MAKLTFSLLLSIARSLKLKGYTRSDIRLYLTGLRHGLKLQEMY